MPQLALRGDNSACLIFLCNKESNFENIGNGYVGKGTQGISFIPLNQSKGLTYKLADYYYDFSLEVVNQYADEKDKKNGIDRLVLKPSYSLNNGSIKVICEYDSQGSERTAAFDAHIGSIYVISFDKKNQIEWTRKIPKKQFNVTSGSSYHILVKGNTLHFIYFDVKTNLNLKPNQSPAKYNDKGNDGYIIGTSLNAAGEMGSYEFGKVSKFPFALFLPGQIEILPYSYVLKDIEKVELGNKSVKRAYLINVK